MKEKYHCVGTYLHIGNTLYMKALCGAEGMESWDYAPEFIQNEIGPMNMTEKCEECANHPDMPLLILGELP
jgi:hypothetical protein